MTSTDTQTAVDSSEQVAVGRARIGGDSWASVWLPKLLVELTRQVAPGLPNVALNSALQASLEEVQQRNELHASRPRIVTAADESRRAIERNLHDGAQQHLVALAVKLGLARQLVAPDPAIAAGQLEELRTDVRSTISAVRELAHGIYPPLSVESSPGGGATMRCSIPTSQIDGTA